MGGVMIDSGPLIAAERAGSTPRRTVEVLRIAAGTPDLSISAIAYTELLHGVFRAHSLSRAEIRLRYLRAVLRFIPNQAYDLHVAAFAAQLRAEQEKIGNKLPFADSLIGATAMFLHRPLLTQNLRDFVRIPGLKIIPFHLLSHP